MIVNSFYDVTMSPPTVNQNYGCSNLSGSYQISVDRCLMSNPLYRNAGAVCYNVINNCTGPISNLDDVKKVQNFCGSFGTSGFYKNGAWFTQGYLD